MFNQNKIVLTMAVMAIAFRSETFGAALPTPEEESKPDIVSIVKTAESYGAPVGIIGLPMPLAAAITSFAPDYGTDQHKLGGTPLVRVDVAQNTSALGSSIQNLAKDMGIENMNPLKDSVRKVAGTYGIAVNGDESVSSSPLAEYAKKYGITVKEDKGSSDNQIPIKGGISISPPVPKYEGNGEISISGSSISGPLPELTGAPKLSLNGLSIRPKLPAGLQKTESPSTEEAPAQ